LRIKGEIDVLFSSCAARQNSILTGFVSASVGKLLASFGGRGLARVKLSAALTLAARSGAAWGILARRIGCL
jgi:hypothetical protein